MRLTALEPAERHSTKKTRLRQRSRANPHDPDRIGAVEVARVNFGIAGRPAKASGSGSPQRYCRCGRAGRGAWSTAAGALPSRRRWRPAGQGCAEPVAGGDFSADGRVAERARAKRDLSARRAYSCRLAWKTTASACWCSSADAGRQEGTRLVNREAPDLGSFCRN